MMLKHAELYCTFPCSTSVRKYVHVLYFNWKVLRIKRPVSDNSCRTLEISKFLFSSYFRIFFCHQGLFMMIVQKILCVKRERAKAEPRQCCYSFRCISRRESSLHTSIVSKSISYSTSIGRRSNSGGLKKYLSFRRKFCQCCSFCVKTNNRCCSFFPKKPFCVKNYQKFSCVTYGKIAFFGEIVERVRTVI